MKKAPPNPEVGYTAVEWSIHAGQTDTVLQRLEANLSRRRKRRRLAGFATMLILLSMGAWQFLPKASPALATRTPTAKLIIPDQRKLPDGSRLELRSDASATVAYSSTLRQVNLENGEGYFEVAKDANRPFVVISNGIEIRALGTAFLVSASPAGIEVLVTEGSVAVEARSSGARQANSGTRLQSGQKILIPNPGANETAGPTPTSLPQADITERLAWRVPRLEFNNTPLSQAIAMFNEHSPMKIHLSDNRNDRLISGLLRTDSVDALLTVLANEFDITVAKRTETGIWLLAP